MLYACRQFVGVMDAQTRRSEAVPRSGSYWMRKTEFKASDFLYIDLCDILRIVQGGRIGTSRVGILTVVDDEFEAVRRVLGGPGVVAEIADSGFYSPTADAKHPDVVLTQTFDRSNGPAQSSCRDMIEKFRPETVIVCGIAGGIAGRDDVGLGDVVVATYLHYVEFQKLSDGGESMRYFPYDQPTSGVVMDHCKPECRDLDLGAKCDCTTPSGLDADWGPNVRFGPMISGEKLFGNPDHPAQQKAAGMFDDALAVDMESVGVAIAVHRSRNDVTYNPRMAVVRGISDLVEPNADPAVDEARNSVQRTTWRPYASAAAATVAQVLTTRLLRLVDPRSDMRTAAQQGGVA